MLFLRRPDAFTNPQLWAEDGSVFLSDARSHGASALWRTLGGYYQLVPRLVAWGASQVHLLWTPALYNLAALGAVIFVALYLLSGRIRLPCKGLMVLAVVFCPHRGEVFMTLANVQWVLSLALLLLVASEEPSNFADRAFDVIVLMLVGLTGPFVFLFLPLLLVRLAFRRTGWSAGLVVVAGVLATVEVMDIQPERVGGNFDPSNSNWMRLLGRSFAGLLLLGDLPFAHRVPDAVLVVASVFLYALFALHCVIARSPTVALLLGGGLAVFAGAAYAHRGGPEVLLVAIGVRYWYVPIVTLLWAASITLRSDWPIAVASGTIWLFSAASTLSMFAAPRYTEFDWRAAVSCSEIRTCVVPINPPGWRMRLVGDQERARSLAPE